MAIPLSSVTRLEEFPSSQIERIGDRLVVQYRGRIMPLVDIGSIFAGNGRTPSSVEPSADARNAISVVVSTEGDQPCGFVVKRILDIVEQDVEVRGTSTRTAVLYSAVIQGRVTEVIDVTALRERIEVNRLAEQYPCEQVPS